MSETIYINRDNVIRLQLLENGVAQSLITVTKIGVKFKSIEITNEVSTTWPIKWTELTETGEIQLRLGNESLLPDHYRGNMDIIVYSADNLNGVVWGNINVVVRDI